MRVFRRPMFRRGGTTNQGIMTGLVDRRRYDMGAFGRTAKEYATDIQSIMGTPDINQLLIQGGLGLVGGQGTGQGALADVATAFQKPTAQYFQQAMANKMAAKKLGVEMAMKEKLAKQKAMAGAGYLKRETPEGAFDHFLEENAKSANALKRWDKPNLSQKYQMNDAEFKAYVWRRLKTTNNPQGKEIERNFIKYVPFDIDEQEFEYDRMLPGMYYYDPKIRAFVQRVPVDGKDTYYKYDRKTYEKYVLDPGDEKKKIPPSWKKLGTK
tara:strand:+ start:165 stop:968 length:804 start_codon:yes stop_codon:yes gene_type:complete